LFAVLCSPFLCRGIESWDLLKTGSKVATAEPNVFWRGSGRHAITSGFMLWWGLRMRNIKSSPTYDYHYIWFLWSPVAFAPWYFVRSFQPDNSGSARVNITWLGSNNLQLFARVFDATLSLSLKTLYAHVFSRSYIFCIYHNNITRTQVAQWIYFQTKTNLFINWNKFNYR
jgi:hypothetical protein